MEEEDQMHFVPFTCFACGMKSPFLKTSHEVKGIIYSFWSRSCAESLTTALDLDPLFVSVFANGSYCSACQQNVREVDYLIRTIKTLQSRLKGFKSKLISAFSAHYESISRDTEDERYEYEGILKTIHENFQEFNFIPADVPMPFSPKVEPLPSEMEDELRRSSQRIRKPLIMPCDTGSSDSEVMSEESCSSYTPEVADSNEWDIDPAPRETINSRQKVVIPPGRSESVRKRGRPRKVVVKCSMGACNFIYAVGNEKLYQLHMRTAHKEMHYEYSDLDVPQVEFQVKQKQCIC